MSYETESKWPITGGEKVALVCGGVMLAGAIIIILCGIGLILRSFFS